MTGEELNERIEAYAGRMGISYLAACTRVTGRLLIWHPETHAVITAALDELEADEEAGR